MVSSIPAWALLNRKWNCFFCWNLMLTHLRMRISIIFLLTNRWWVSHTILFPKLPTAIMFPARRTLDQLRRSKKWNQWRSWRLLTTKISRRTCWTASWPGWPGWPRWPCWRQAWGDDWVNLWACSLVRGSASVTMEDRGTHGFHETCEQCSKPLLDDDCIGLDYSIYWGWQ